jgi:hypothetical protein
MAMVHGYMTRSAVKHGIPFPQSSPRRHKHKHDNKRVKTSPVVIDIDDDDDSDEEELQKTKSRLSCAAYTTDELRAQLQLKSQELESILAKMHALQTETNITKNLLEQITPALAQERAEAYEAKAALTKARADIASLQEKVANQNGSDDHSNRVSAAELRAANETIANLRAELAKTETLAQQQGLLMPQEIDPPVVPVISAVPQGAASNSNSSEARLTELEERIRHLTECVNVRDQALQHSKQKIRQLMPIIKVAPTAPLNTVMYMAAFNFYHCILLPMNDPAFQVKITGNKENDARISESIKSFIREKRIKVHPDKNIDNSAEARSLFQHLEYIEGVLCNVRRRARYNQLLAQYVTQRSADGTMFAPWTYIPHGGVLNTDIACMNNFLDGRTNRYAPAWCYIRGSDQLPTPNVSTLCSCVYFEGVVTKLE